MSQVRTVLTRSDPASVAGAFVWAYRKLFGKEPVRGSWAIPMAQSALETDHWLSMHNWNTGYVTGGSDFYVMGSNPLQFTSYKTLGQGAMGQLFWLANHSCISHADAGDLAGYVSCLQAGGYAGNADYTQYQNTMAAYLQQYANVVPSNYWDLTPATIGVIAVGALGVAGLAAYWLEPELFHHPLKTLGFGGASESGAHENPAPKRLGTAMRVQSYLFDKTLWTEDRARHWLVEHDHKASKVDVTDRYYRFRQESPKKFQTFRTKVLGNGIKAVMGRP